MKLEPVFSSDRLAIVPLNGVGLGWRPELAVDLLRSPREVDFVEVVAETCFASPPARREARAVAEIWPVVPHGVKLSLGSADGIDLDKADRLGALARELRSPAVTEHVAMTRGGRREIGHLTAIPYTAEAVRVVAKNVAATRRLLPDVPFLLENIAWTFRWPDDAMDEGAFYEEIVRATGCDLLLDVANLYANAMNAGASPEALLDRYPLDRVGMVHVAGGITRHGFYEDTHAHAVAPEVLRLLSRLLERTGPLPVILERDGSFPPWEELSAEVRALRSVHAGAPARVRVSATPAGDDGALSPAMAGRQDEVAVLLAAPPRSGAGSGSFAAEAIERTRIILEQKRLDDALPLLPRMAQAGSEFREAALEAIRTTPRNGEPAGIADARLLADLAASDPRFETRGRWDRLELRSRFNRRNRPRLLPFVGMESAPPEGSVWALKGLGRTASTRILEWRSR